MDGVSYQLTVSELHRLSTDASLSAGGFLTYDMPITFFNQTDSITGELNSAGQYVQLNVSNGGMYMLCMFTTDTTDLACTESVSGTLFLFVTVNMNKVTCKPESISTVTSYGYARYPSGDTIVQKAFVSFMVSDQTVAKPSIPPSVAGINVTLMTHMYNGVTGQPTANLVTMPLLRSFFNQANAEGEQDKHGVFVQLQVGPAYWLCMFEDCQHLVCVKSDEGQLYNHYVLPTGNVNLEKNLVMEYGWGHDHTDQAMVLWGQN